MLLAWSAAGSASTSGGGTPVVATPAVEETVAAGTGYVAWAAAPKSTPHAFVAYAKKRGGSRFRVSPPGTKAFMGGIDGTTLIYQQIDHGQSDLKVFDLATKHRSDPPAGVNTKAWEYDPSISGPWILFARFMPATSTRSVVLFNTSTSRTRVLGAVHGAGNHADAGQVDGAFATWMICTPTCNVFVMSLTTGKKHEVPNPHHLEHYNPGVSPNGTVFFGQSGKGCGTHANIFRFSPGHASRIALSLPNGDDVGDIYVVAGAGHTQVYFNHARCPHDLDIYKFVAS